MSQKYQDMVQFALKECARLDMTMGLLICDGFSQTGGPWITPETGMRKSQYDVISVRGRKSFSTNRPENAIRILAYPKLEQDAILKKRSHNSCLVNPEQPYLTGKTSRSHVLY